MTKQGLRIAFFGSSLVSAYWNGAATYYRGIIRALHQLGHEVTFFEPNAYERQAHRDIPDPHWARVVVYPATEAGVDVALGAAKSADVIVKASGVGVFDSHLEAAVPAIAAGRAFSIFWDVDAPATLARLQADASDPLLQHIPRYDLVLTYGGGDPVVRAYEALGARQCVPVYNALDPDTHFPVAPEQRFKASLAFLGNRLPDRERRVEEFFLNAALMLPEHTFLLGGNGWRDKSLPGNVHYAGHVYTRDHNAFNCSPLAVLNISRDSMAANGFSPATRVFEAAGAGACIISDAWEGIEMFLEPGQEILLAHSASDVEGILSGLSPERARRIGERARARILAQHTYRHRAAELQSLLSVAPKVAVRRTGS